MKVIEKCICNNIRVTYTSTHTMLQIYRIQYPYSYHTATQIKFIYMHIRNGIQLQKVQQVHTQIYTKNIHKNIGNKKGKLIVLRRCKRRWIVESACMVRVRMCTCVCV